MTNLIIQAVCPQKDIFAKPRLQEHERHRVDMIPWRQRKEKDYQGFFQDNENMKG